MLSVRRARMGVMRATPIGGLFDGPLEAVELEDSEEKVDGEGCVGFEFFVEDEEDFGFLLIERGTSVLRRGGGSRWLQRRRVGRAGAEDAGEMFGLLAGEGGVGGRPD